jgi:hypothetical protein
MTLGTLLVIVLVIALLGGFRDWGRGPFYGAGYFGSVRVAVWAFLRSAEMPSKFAWTLHRSLVRHARS